MKKNAYYAVLVPDYKNMYPMYLIYPLLLPETMIGFHHYRNHDPLDLKFDRNEFRQSNIYLLPTITF